MTEPRSTTGATKAAEKKKPMWPWLLLAAVLAALLLWWLIAEFTGDDDEVALDSDAGAVVEETTTETETETSVTTETPAAPAAPATVLALTDVLEPGFDASANVGELVEADTAEVQAVIADEAFFVGPEAGQTIMVRLEPFGGTDDPESPFEVQEGDTVSFSGTLQEIDDAFLADLQLYTPAEDLETGDYYLQASGLTMAE